jgi:hypothetical protein
MALIVALFAALGRVFGRVANLALGWATVLLFGRIPQSKQTLLSFVTLGSLAWVAALVGVLVPDAGTFLLAAIPRPEFIPEEWVRLAMLVVAIVLPILIGAASVGLLSPADRPTGAALVVQVLRGYPYAGVLAVTLAFLAAIAIARKVRSLLRRWEDAHVAALVKPGGYERVLVDLEAALDDAGLEVERTRAPRILAIPPRLLGAVGGPGVRALVPDELAKLKRSDLEILVYPSDIALMGAKRSVARGRAAIAARLMFTEAYLTAAKESQEIEQRLKEIARSDAISRGDFQEIDRRLGVLIVPFDEWETLYRLRLQVENQGRLGDTSEPGIAHRRIPGDAPAEAAALAGPARWVAALGLIVLMGLDVLLALRERRERTRSRRSRLRRP